MNKGTTVLYRGDSEVILKLCKAFILVQSHILNPGFFLIYIKRGKPFVVKQVAQHNHTEDGYNFSIWNTSECTASAVLLSTLFSEVLYDLLNSYLIKVYLL